MFEAITSAIEILQTTESLVLPAEATRAQDPTACSGYRCAPVLEFIFLVTDGHFVLNPELVDGLERFREARPRMQLLGVAVGDDAVVSAVRELSCGLNGITFALPPPAAGEGSSAAYSSYILNELNEFYQLVAAPLARNHSQITDPRLSVDVTWDLPRNPYGSEVMITIALPCFGDANSDSHSLLGVVAVDLVRPNFIV